MQKSLEALRLSIDRLSKKGYGVGKGPSGREIEVAHALPGDHLFIEWKRRRRDPQKGRLLEVVTPSANRVSPRCPHAKLCGGCSWQQMDYRAQLEEKMERVKKAFKNRYEVEPILAAQEIFGYRNKMEFTFSENRGGMRYLGLMIAQAEPYVFNLEECHLGPSWFGESLQSVRAWWESSGLLAYRPPEDSGALRYLTLRHAFRTEQKMAVLNVSGNPDYALDRSQIGGFAKIFNDETSLFLRIHQTKKGKPTQFFEMHLKGPDHILEELHIKDRKLSIKISPISFFQPNPMQAEKLYEKALEMLGDTGTLFDLYSGTATLAMAASLQAKKVVAIELSPEAVLDAEENLKRNQIENVTLYQGDVGKVLTQLCSQPQFQRPDAVIVDPPRAGLDPLAISYLKNLSPKKILYISCNPITQAENVEELVAAGYRVEKLQPVDQFPHTYHIENIALLTKKPSL